MVEMRMRKEDHPNRSKTHPLVAGIDNYGSESISD